MTTTTIDDYQTLCEKGRLAAGTMDTGRWIVGDLACLVVSRYREHNLDDFAREINVKKKSVYQYRQVAEFYEPSTRVDFLATNPRITYTHMRDAMAFKDAAKAYEFLAVASMNGYTTDEAAYYIGEQLNGDKKKPLISGEMTVDECIARLMTLATDKRVKVVVKDVTL